MAAFNYQDYLKFVPQIHKTNVECETMSRDNFKQYRLILDNGLIIVLDINPIDNTIDICYGDGKNEVCLNEAYPGTYYVKKIKDQTMSFANVEFTQHVPLDEFSDNNED